MDSQAGTQSPTRPDWDRIRAAHDAVSALGRGDLVVILEDAGGRAEGNLTLAAEHTTPDRLNTMVKLAGGITVLCLTDEDCERLGFTPVGEGSGYWAAAVSVDWPSGHPPASAEGRAATIRAALDPATDRRLFRRPGHITPIRARPHGLLERLERTEAAIDLVRATGRLPAAVSTLILNPDGSVASGADVVDFARRHDLPLVTVTDAAALRWRTERVLERVASAELPTAHGTFDAIGYHDRVTGEHHLVLVRGNVAAPARPLVRVQRRCFAGDVLGARTCGCSGELERALDRLAAEDSAVLIYLMAATGLDLRIGQPHERDLERDERLAWMAASILRDLGVDEVDELRGGAAVVDGLREAGIRVVDRLDVGALAPGRP